MREKRPEAADRFVAARKRVGATQSYVIASTPRSGSYLLCEALAATGVAGRPTEPFNPEFLWDFHQRWGLSADVGFQEYWYQAVLHGTTGNGVFGVKIHWGQLDWLAEQAGAGRGDVLAQLLPGARYVRLVRRDRRAQAISLYRASASNEWWRIPGMVNPQVTGADPEFDARAVRRLEASLQGQDQAWAQHLNEQGAVALVVEYESLACRLRDEVARVLAFIGQDSLAALSIPEPRLVRQADGKTLAWRKRLDAGGAPRGLS
jgi:LPS sulfotransferase NodH